MLAIIWCRIFFSYSVLSKNIKIKIYRPIILSVLCRFETWSLALREEHRLKVFDSRVLRKIFRPKEGQSKRTVEKTT